MRPPSSWAAGGDVLSYRDIDERSNRLARLLRGQGLTTGDHIAILMGNCATYLEVAWAAQRSGLYYTALNSHLRSAEVQYILDDCGATALVTTPDMADVVSGLDLSRISVRLSVGGPLAGFSRYEAAVSTFEARAGPRRVRRARDALLVGDDGTAQGGPQGASPYPHGRRVGGPGADRPGHGATRRRGRVGLPVTGAAVPLGAARVLHVDAPPRGDGGGDGALRRGTVSGAHRATSGDARPIRAHHVRPHAAPARERASPATTSRACGRWCTPRRRAPWR